MLREIDGISGYREWLDTHNKRVCDESEEEYKRYVEGEIYGESQKRGK